MNTISKFLALTLIATAPLAYAADGDTGKTAAPSSPAAQEYNYKTPKLKRAAIDALLAHPAKLTIIDLRRPDELTNIGGFPVYLSIQPADLEKSLPLIPKERTIVTVSNHAHRAGAAADFLVSKGYKVAGTVGVLEYVEEGGALTKIAPPAPKAN